MLNIDGLASGLDTASIIEGLLSIQQQQVDRYNERKQAVEEERTAFQEIETRLLEVQSKLGELSTPRTNAFLRKKVTASDETIIDATVSNDAASGVYSLFVNQLARNHQVASNEFESPDAALSSGVVTISVGTGGAAQEIDLTDDAGNTVEGLTAAINNKVDGVTASIVPAADGYKLLLSSDQTGSANAITVSSTAPELSFDLDNPVQEALDAEVQLGTGSGAIVANSETNQIDELFAGVTMNLLRASPGEEVQLTVKPDNETAKEAVQAFVDAYNSFIDYTNEQSDINVEDGTTATLFGNRSLRTIRNEISTMITRAVPGVIAEASGERINRLSNLGIRLENDGTLTINESELDAVLNGEIEGIGQAEINQLMGYDGISDNDSIQLLSATADTHPSDDQPYGVIINRAASQATLIGSQALAETIEITSSDNQLTLAVDGFEVDPENPLTLTEGSYTQDELADHVEDVIAASSDLPRREVRVSIVDDKLQIRSLSYGDGSSISQLGGTALSKLGLDADQSASGTNVQGSFTYLDDNGQTITEEATGSGTILRGNRKNERTAGLSLHVTLSPSDLEDAGGSVTASMSVTQGIAARLDRLIEDITDRTQHEEGEIAIAMREFDGRIENLDLSLERLNAEFQRQEESLLRQFTNLERRIGELQGLASTVSAQLGSLPSFNRG